MKGNGNRIRRKVSFDGEQYVVIMKSKRQVVLEKLEGDFSDYRRLLGITQKELAKRLEISASLVSRYEDGSRVIKPETEQKCRQMIKAAQRTS